MQDMADAAKNPSDTLPRVWKWFETNFINQLASLRDLELNIKGKLGQGMDSAFKAAEIALNDPGRNEALMHYGAGDIDVHGAFRPAENTIGLRPMLAKLENAGYSDKGQAAVDWMEYMVARRARDLKGRGIKTPLSDADIQRGLDKQNAVFDEIAADWKRFNDANVDLLVKTGRVSKALGAKLKEDAAYVPLYRSDETVEGTSDMFDNTELAKRVSRGPTGRGGVLARDPGIKRIKGGDRLKINNVIENMIRNSQAMVAASMRNQAANKSFDLLQQAGYARVEPARMQSAKTGEWVARKMPDHAVRMWRDGEESYLVPETAESVPVLIGLAGLQPQQINGIHRQMANIASFFRQGITLSPAFILRNTWRDMVSTGVLTSGRNLRLDNNLVTGVVASLKRSSSRRAFTAQSGMGDFRFGGRDIGLGRNDYMIELGVLPKTAGYQLRRVIGAGEMLGTASELSNRIALMDQLVSEGVRQDEAAYQALTITNYSRKGSNAVLRSMLPLIPFLNARIQGLARIGEDITARRGKDRQQAIMRLALNGTVLATASTLLWGWNNRDEENRERYLAEPLHRRLNYNVIYGENTKILIPKAFEVGTIFGTVPEIMMEAMAGNTEEIGPAAVMTLTNTFGFNPMPAALLPAFEVAADYNFFTGQAIEGGRLSGLMTRDRINPQTSATAVALGRAGLSDFAGLSPVVLDHLLYGYGGVYYSTLAAMTDMVAGEMGLVPREPEGKFGSVPFASQGLQQALGGMVRDVDADVANKYMNDFYEHRNAISQIYRSAREAALSGDVEYAREIMSRAPATPEAYRFVNTAGSRLSDVNAEIRRIRMDRQMTAAQKRKKLQPLVKARNNISMKVMQHIKKIEDAQGTSFRRAS